MNAAKNAAMIPHQKIFHLRRRGSFLPLSCLSKYQRRTSAGKSDIDMSSVISRGRSRIFSKISKNTSTKASIPVNLVIGQFQFSKFCDIIE